MKKIILILLPIFLLSFLLAFAGTFRGLEPGISKKSDADRILGKPKLEVVRGVRYDYEPGHPDTRRISIKFYRDTQVIETIDIYPQEAFSKDQYKEWLGLEVVQETARDAGGNLIEYYVSSGIALHFAGPEDSSSVEFFSHFDPQSLEPSKPAGSPAARDETYYTQAAEEAVEKKDWPRAKLLIDQGLRLYPDSAGLWNERASYYFSCESEPSDVRMRETLSSARKAYKLNPITLHALNLGWIHLEMHKDYSSALIYFIKVEKEYAPQNPALYYWMARCYEETLVLDMAKAYYARFLEVAPDHVRAEDARNRLNSLK